jgi:2-oxoisovalerate dehydrogenase E1 component
VLANIRGIKVVYPSTGADLKGLLKAAFYDPNPVVILEHKGLYWSKIPGTEGAMSIEPSEDYVVPIGKARIVQEASQEAIQNSESIGIITYGRGVYWSAEAAQQFTGQIEILDLRTINPLDMPAMEALCQRHGKILLVTEESSENSFTLAIAGRLQQSCFQYLDAPLEVVASVDAPAIPLNSSLEAAMLPNAQKVATAISKLLQY